MTVTSYCTHYRLGPTRVPTRARIIIYRPCFFNKNFIFLFDYQTTLSSLITTNFEHCIILDLLDYNITYYVWFDCNLLTVDKITLLVFLNRHITQLKTQSTVRLCIPLLTYEPFSSCLIDTIIEAQPTDRLCIPLFTFQIFFSC